MITFLMIAFSLIIIEPPTASAAPATNAAPLPLKAGALFQIDAPCTTDESWSDGPALPKSLQKKYSPPQSQEDAFRALSQGLTLKKANVASPLKFLGDYLIYRSYYQLNLIHFAERGFSSLLTVPPANAQESENLMNMKFAALGCINTIHKAHPAIKTSPLILPFFQSLPFSTLPLERKSLIWSTLTSIASGELAEKPNPTPEVLQAIALLSGSGPYLEFVQASEALKRGSEKEAQEHFQRLVDSKKIPEDLKHQMNGVYLNLGRLYFNQKNYARAIQAFKKVEKESNFFAQSLGDLAWAYHLQNDFNQSSAFATNLLVGNLKDVFYPDAPQIMAISYFENCNYHDVSQVIHIFKKNYQPTYQVLYDWHQSQKKVPASFYELAIQAAQGRSRLPRNLTFEWLRSPVFIAKQQEINLIIDEVASTQSLISRLQRNPAVLSKQNTPTKAYYLSLIQIFRQWHAEAAILEKNAIVQINQEIHRLNDEMIRALVDAFENIQLIDFENLKAMGQRMLIKQDATDPQKRSPSSFKQSQQKTEAESVPVLKWGSLTSPQRAEGHEDEKEELWEDELGSLQTEITNLCHSKMNESQ